MKTKHVKLFKNVLKEYENLSTCDRLHVAALLVKDGRILSVGYNGVPAGNCHCNTQFKHIEKNNEKEYYQKTKEGWISLTEEEYRKNHHEFSEANEIHAETNCLCTALKNNVNISGCSMVLSVSPCQKCAKMILASGVNEVLYVDEYDASTEGNDFLRNNGVSVEKI